MQEAALLPLAAWQNFYVIIGTAAGTLTGLMFVVITLIADARVRVPSPGNGIAVFSTPNVVHFCLVLLTAAILSAPWQALWNVSLLLGLTGLGGVIYAIIVLWRARNLQTDYQPVFSDWLWYSALPLVAYIALVVAAILLPISPTPAIFIVGAATLLLLFTGIRNAWDVVTFVPFEYSRPED